MRMNIKDEVPKLEPTPYLLYGQAGKRPAFAGTVPVDSCCQIYFGGLLQNLNCRLQRHTSRKFICTVHKKRFVRRRGNKTLFKESCTAYNIILLQVKTGIRLIGRHLTPGDVVTQSTESLRIFHSQPCKRKIRCRWHLLFYRN